jgi:Zn finger protein HypA/HybF involved in hydrogenase expression
MGYAVTAGHYLVLCLESAPVEQTAMNEDVSTLTVYDGSLQCKKCDYPMTPLEAMYSDDGLCPYCRNAKYEKHAKNLMA